MAIEYTEASPEKQAYLDVTDVLRRGYVQLRSSPTEVRDEARWDLLCGVNDVPNVRAYYESCHRAVEQHLTNNQALDLERRLFAARALHGYIRAQSQLVASYWGTHEALTIRLKAYSQQIEAQGGDLGEYTINTEAGRTFNLFAKPPMTLIFNEADWFMNRVDHIRYNGAAYLPPKVYTWEIFALIAGGDQHTCGGRPLEMMVPVLDLLRAWARGEEGDALAAIEQAAHQYRRDVQPEAFSNAAFDPFTHVMHAGARIEVDKAPDDMALQAVASLYPAPEACLVLVPLENNQQEDAAEREEENRVKALAKAQAEPKRAILPPLGLTGEEHKLEEWAEKAMGILQADIGNPEAIMRVGRNCDTFPDGAKKDFREMVAQRVNGLQGVTPLPEFGKDNGAKNIALLITWLQERDIADKAALIQALEHVRDEKYRIDASHDLFLEGIFQVMRVVSWIEQQGTNDQQKEAIGALMFTTCDTIKEQYKRCAAGAKGRGFLLHHYLWQFLKAQSEA